MSDTPSTTSEPTGPVDGTGSGVGPVTEHTDLRGLLAGSDDANARDHVALALGTLAGLTDRGLRRRRNEDAVALGRCATTAGDVAVAMVCDGVASARRGDEASLAAVEAAVDAALSLLVVGVGDGDDLADDDQDGPASGPPAAPSSPVAAPGAQDLDPVASAAADAAAEAAAALGRDTVGGDTPACTYVGAVALRGDAVVSWVGDSRVYWLAADGPSRLLTVDDSWAEEIAAAGLMPREQAFHDRRAHVLTRWLGHDSPPGPARSRRIRVGSPGVLMLCSDGVWNHLPDAEVLAGLVRGLDAEGAARALVDAALDDGGHDNATVAIVPMVPDDDPDTDGIRIEGRTEARTGPIPLGEEDPA